MGGPNPRCPVAVTSPTPRQSPQLEKLERDCIRLIDALSEMRRDGVKQTLRAIAEKAGMSKDEVNRYLNPRVNELYNLERLLRVRAANRPLYNHLIVSGPPRVEAGSWTGIETNTSKFVLFKAVAQRFGYDVKYIGDNGVIIDLVYRGIENMALDRMGKVFAAQEPILHLDQIGNGS